MKEKLVNIALVERLTMLFNEARENKNLTLEQIEKDVGVSKGALSKYANGIHVPNSEIVRKISNYFNVSADYLLGSSDNRRPDIVRFDEIPVGYLNVVRIAIEKGITEDPLLSVLEATIKLKKD